MDVVELDLSLPVCYDDTLDLPPGPQDASHQQD